MEYWKQIYYELLGEVRKLEEKIHELDCTIYRADTNQKTLKKFGRLEYDDDFDYDNMSTEEKLAAVETIYIESIEECRQLEIKLKLKRMDLIFVSEAIVEAINSFMTYPCEAKITLAQQNIFNEYANDRVVNVLERTL